MRATSIKAILVAAGLIFPAWSFAQTKSKDAAAYANRGVAKLQKRDWDGAIADFNRALQFDPKLAKAYLDRGIAKTNKGDRDGAIADYNRALQLDPRLATAYQARGIAKLQKNDFDGAIADFDRALQFDPKLAKAYVDRGLAKRGKCELTTYGGVGDFVSDYTFGSRKVLKRELVGAIADFNRALQLDPKNANAYRNRGIAKIELGDLNGAIADYNRALQFDPKFAAAYVNRGLAKQEKGDLDSAIVDYNRAFELNPKLGWAYVDRGSAKLLKSDAAGAIGDFNRALELDPKLIGAYSGRGSANFLARNWPAALRDYRRFCELSPRLQEYPRLFIWIIRSRLGEREAANKELSTNFTTAQGSWQFKVKAYLLGNLAEADFLAAASSPDAKSDRRQHCEALFYGGMKNLLNGNKPAATEFFKKCLATEEKSVVEYDLAKAELKALGQ